MFVSGCHRSGTSVLASILQDLIYFHDPNTSSRCLPIKSSLENTLDNPLGFFEGDLLRTTNDSLLAAVDSSWDHPPLLAPDWSKDDLNTALIEYRSRFTQYSLNPLWVDKDPRLCLTYPAWSHILLRRVPAAVVIRHPFQVAWSLHNRNGWSFDRSFAFWFLYNHHLSRSLTHSDFITDFDSLASASLNNYFPLSLHHWLSSAIPELSTDRVISVVSTRFKSSLNRSVLEPPPISTTSNSNLLDLVGSLYQDLTLSGSLSIHKFKSIFSSIPDPILSICSTNPSVIGGSYHSALLSRKLADSIDQNRRLSSEYNAYKLQVQSDTQRKDHEFLEHLSEHRSLIASQARHIELLSRSPLRRLASLLKSLLRSVLTRA